MPSRRAYRGVPARKLAIHNRYYERERQGEEAFPYMKVLFWIGSATIVLGLGCAMIYFMREAAAEAETSRRMAQAESECVMQIQRMGELVTKKDDEKGVRSRVTQSTSHFNQALRRCYVEVTTYERSNLTLFVKTLLTPA